jgi:hypothetical protein
MWKYHGLKKGSAKTSGLTSSIRGGMILSGEFTGLCKRILLKAFQVSCRRRYRLCIDNNPSYEPREFDVYLHDYGPPRSIYQLSRLQAIEREVIAELDSRVMGGEFDRQFFFLPFQPATDSSIAKQVDGPRGEPRS